MPYVKPKGLASIEAIGSSSDSSNHSSSPPSSTSRQDQDIESDTRDSHDDQKDNPMEDLPTPRPGSSDPMESKIPVDDLVTDTTDKSLDDLSSTMATTSLNDPSLEALPEQSTMPQTMDTTSRSTTSLASMSGESHTEADTASESEITTPPTTDGADIHDVLDDGIEDPVARYKEGLYAYTRTLYLQAKLSQSRKDNMKGYNQFGLKQSGMEKMAAKKALARRLNA